MEGSNNQPQKETNQFIEMLIRPLRDQCPHIDSLMTKSEKGRRFSEHEADLLIDWLSFLGEMGTTKLHALLSGEEWYSRDLIKEKVHAYREEGHKPIPCSQLRETGACQCECALFQTLGQEGSPIQFFIDDSKTIWIFKIIKEDDRCLIVRANNGTALKFSQFEINDGKTCSRIECFQDEQLVYSDRVSLSTGKSRTQFANKCLQMGKQNDLKAMDIERCLTLTEEKLREKIYDAPERAVEQSARPKMTPEQREEALAFLRNPSLKQIILGDMEKLGHVGESLNKFLIYLVCVSRKLKKPLACLIRATSAAGKNAAVGTVLELMPDEEKKVISRLTANALYYLSKQGLAHMVVAIAERSGSEESDYPIRTLLSEGRLVNFVPIRNADTGQIETQEIVVEGPIALLETTTQPTVNNENATRLFSIYIDESEGQTKLIHEIQRRDKTLEGLLENTEREAVRSKHQNAQRLLKKLDVVIPYAQLLQFPTHSVRTRRDHEKFLYLIMAIAFLRQYQKEPKCAGSKVYIEADITDYEIAHELSELVLGQTIDEVSRKSRELMEIINDMVMKKFKENSGELFDEKKGLLPTNILFTRADVRPLATGWSDASLHACLKELSRYELLRVAYGGKQGSTYKYTLMGDSKTSSQGLNKLLTPAELREQLGLLPSTSPQLSQESHGA
ncbi:MAG: hypothetical protein WC484_04885 [Candidatus Omnitrophota bacterium]